MTNSFSLTTEVQETHQTALSRLGSSKSLYAETGGEIDRLAVLRAAGSAEHAAWTTFRDWATDESNPEVRDFFEAVAVQERAHLQTILDELDEEIAAPSPVPAMHDCLRTQADTVDRLGGFIGRCLASKRSKEQVVGFFVGAADTKRAGYFRAFGEDLTGQREQAEALLSSHFTTETDRRRAAEAAGAVIEAAYGEYVAALEELGANPKPIC